MIQKQIFLAFLKVGLLGYGGGPSSIPLVHTEVVKNYQWMNDDEFADILALGNTLPGPIATKMAGYIGYRVAGVLGMMNALVATIIPTVVLMIVFLSTLSSIKDQPWVIGMTRAVVPVVGVMLVVMTWDFIVRAKKDLGLVKAIILTILSLVLIEYLDVHPGIVIVVLLVLALGGKTK